MASFEFLAIILTGLGLTASILYYSTIIQNANKTRQNSTYIQAIGFRDANYMKAFFDIIYFQKYTDYEDWKKKYHPSGEEWKDEYKDSWANFFAVGNTFHSIGLLVSQGIVSPDLVYKQEGELIISLWERMSPIIIGTRNDSQQFTFFSHYEYLYEEMKKIDNKRKQL